MIRGKTKIELTDVHTKEIETIEEENMVTNALRYIFNPLGYIKAGSVMYGPEYVNYYETLTGGLLLLNKSIEENADNIFLGTDVGLTGCAVYKKQNSSDQGLRGNYNTTESEIDLENRRIKYVYDFDTAEGNGTIAAVALTHAYGGYSNRGCAADPISGAYPFFKKLGDGLLRLCGNNAKIGAYDRTASFTTYGTDCHWIFLIDAEKDMVYYFTLMNSTTIRIRGYRANINTVSLFDTPSTSRVLLFEKTVTCTTAFNMQYFTYNYEEETEKLFITFGTSYTISKNGSFSIVEIDIANDYAVKQYAMTNTTGFSLRMFYDKYDTLCFGGYIYLMSASAPRNIYREEIGNSANVQKIETEVRECYPAFAKDNRVYFEDAQLYSSAAKLYVVETDSFTLKYLESNCLADDSHRQFVPIKGVPMTYFATGGTYDGTFVFRTDYLATINNLANSVVKTADKTMKVTYTLTEE